ncbi:MAG TPA: ATP-binding protein, partial [Reyranella sp.]|nr:ATP-binding protein [Reyranella sp.]
FRIGPRQGERSIDRSQGGLGIGLTLVRHLVELHGGTIPASSDGPGRGSLFTVRLPAIAAAAPDTLEVAPTEAASGPPGRLLIVEDNAEAREMLRIVLAHDGHDVHEAVDGLSGVQAALSPRPDISIGRSANLPGRAHGIRPAGGPPACRGRRLRRARGEAHRPHHAGRPARTLASLNAEVCRPPGRSCPGA